MAHDRVLLFLGALVVMAVVNFLRAMFQPEVTLGDVLAIVTPLILSGFGYWLFVVRPKKRPFRMKIANEPYDIPVEQCWSRTYGRTARLGRGKTKLTIMVQTEVAANIARFNVRFFERRWNFGKLKREFTNVNQDIIRIVEVHASDWEHEAERERDFIGPNTIEANPDHAGGFYVTSRLPKRWVVKQQLWIEMTVEASRDWSGYISFESYTDRRAWVRRRVVVSDC